MDKDKFIKEYFAQYNRLASIIREIHSVASHIPNADEIRKKIPDDSKLNFCLREITANMKTMEKRAELTLEMMENMMAMETEVKV